MTKPNPDRPNRPKTVVRRTQWPGGSSTPVVTPLNMSVVYGAESPDALDAIYDGDDEGWTYAREGHPNAAVLAEKIDALEGMERGVITGSGMSAVTAALLSVAQAGDHVIGARQLYGRSLRLMNEDLPRMGMTTSLVDTSQADAVAEAIRPNTRAILIEVVSNPTLRIADLPGIAALVQERGIALIVDNTFTTPRAVRPKDFGADIILHSVTKLLAGHSDATLGYVAATNGDVATRLETIVATMGLTPSPFDCWLAERGLYSFDLRYDRAEENATALAAHLSQVPGVTRVLYPGLDGHPDAAKAAEILGQRTGNMICFDVSGGRAAANALVRAAKDLPFAPTLGDIGTTLSHPATSSHRALSEAQRAEMGITEGTFRVSVGVEPLDLLTQDFDRAIAASRDA